MFLNNIKHNLIMIFCILLMINGCNRENSKLIIENKSTPEKPKITNKVFVNKSNLKKKVLKSTVLKKNILIPKEKQASDIRRSISSSVFSRPLSLNLSQSQGWALYISSDTC